MDDKTRHLFLIDIWQIIIEYLQCSQQYSIINSNPVFKQKLYIYELFSNHGIDVIIDDNFLKQHCFSKLRILHASHNERITDVNHLIHLKCLYASKSCGIGNEGIKQLTGLKILFAHDNKNIININHLLELEELVATGSCGIDDAGIKQLINIRKLHVDSNEKIINVNHMQKLRYLDAWGNLCGINDAGIKQLTKLEKLNAGNNEKIKDVNHMLLLEELDASGNCGIDKNGIKQLLNRTYPKLVLNKDKNRKLMNSLDDFMPLFLDFYNNMV